jgi:uncharacterized membrane protein (DUF485 family)
MLQKNKLLLFGFLFLLITWLFTGIYKDDEFYEAALFTKRSPSPKAVFYSPIGMSDKDIGQLSPDKQAEENAFREQVLEANVPEQGLFLATLPYGLIQLTLTFLFFGIYSLFSNRTFKPWHFILHFIINFFTTGIGIAAFLNALDLEGLPVTGSILAGILVFNAFSMFIITFRRKKKA